MHSGSNRQNIVPDKGCISARSILLWLALATGWAISVFTVIQDMCMVSACRDTAGFTIFGLNLGWFGIAYFSLLLIVLWLRKNDDRLDWLLSALVFSALGAEFRLLWIQKFIIGGWCPLCVAIFCAILVAVVILVVEKLCGTGRQRVKGLMSWLVLIGAMSVIGLAVAVMWVKALN
jgi:uncharacterized membrane protein